MTPSGPVVIEVNGRVGGGVPKMLFAITGVDLLALTFGIATDMVVNMEALNLPPLRLAYIFFVQSPIHLTGITEIEELA